MTTATGERGYRPTESKYRGGAQEMYVTYDLEQKTAVGTKPYIPRSSASTLPAMSRTGSQARFAISLDVKFTVCG